MNFRIFDNLEDLSQAAARAVRESGAKTIAVTGGSTPKRMYEILGDDLPRDVTWVLVDERYVPMSDPQSNAAMIERTLFARGVPERWLRFKTELDDPAETARVFQEEWNALGIGDVDLAILGCGDDGHTASLFPGSEALDVNDRVATAAFVPRLNQWRVTLTMDAIREAKVRFVLAAGEGKAAVIREVRDGADLPVARATMGNVSWWFVDAAAAASTNPER